MFPKFKQLNLFGTKTEDFAGKQECQKAQELTRGDSRPRDPPEPVTICQGKKAILTEIQKERARSLHQKSKDLVSKAYEKNPTYIKSETNEQII